MIAQSDGLQGGTDRFRSGDRPTVAVVGAGISGAVCANRLAAHGWQVTVFEKGRGPGGRMATRRAAGRAFDHGASYFTVSDGRFRSLVEPWLDCGRVAEWAGRWAVVRNGEVTVVPAARRYVAVPGMSALARELLSDVECRYGTAVQRLARSAGAWHVSDAAGASLGNFDVVIVSAPPSQAAALAVGQTPLVAAVERVAMLPCWAVAAGVSSPLNVPFDGAAVAGSPLGWVARDSGKPGRTPWPQTWMLHATAEWSAEHLEEDAQAVGDVLLDAFREVADLGSVEAEVVTAHRWRSARPETHSALGALFDEERGIGFCGDWLARGRVESAAMSGWDLADRVLAGRRMLSHAGSAA
jgi:predicted NAD/FAD-dependent oxidoreductase